LHIKAHAALHDGEVLLPVIRVNKLYSMLRIMEKHLILGRSWQPKTEEKKAISPHNVYVHFFAVQTLEQQLPHSRKQ
jgi:hypothetical protein